MLSHNSFYFLQINKRECRTSIDRLHSLQWGLKGGANEETNEEFRPGDSVSAPAFHVSGYIRALVRLPWLSFIYAVVILSVSNSSAREYFFQNDLCQYYSYGIPTKKQTTQEQKTKGKGDI